KINEEGILSDDKEASKLITWQEILSVKAMRYSILLITKKETVILPKKDMEDVFDHFIKLLNQHVSGQRMKLGQKNI
ncbi:MAG: YcxB family protein, partial [Clostridiales bacterium]|nr:YcxB family protein [Clostridiales bacterium]